MRVVLEEKKDGERRVVAEVDMPSAPVVGDGIALLSDDGGVGYVVGGVVHEFRGDQYIAVAVLHENNRWGTP